MLELTLIHRFLNPHVSAASGLVRIGSEFYIIADDEHFLLHFDRTGRANSIPLLAVPLPEEKADRKKRKADFESLLQLDEDTLLALPSGSRSNRQRAVKIKLKSSQVEVLDYSDFFSELNKIVSEINLEGAVLLDNQIVYFQRGNGESGENGLVIQEKGLKFWPVDLGSINGCAYTFTDACRFKDYILFTAVAEASRSTYEDGANLGAILGLLTPEGKLINSQQLPAGLKPEGICLDESGKKFYLVTDDDDRTNPSGFYSGCLPLEWLTL